MNFSTTTLRRSFMLGIRSPASTESSRSMIVNLLICSQRFSSRFSLSMYPAISSCVLSSRAIYALFGERGFARSGQQGTTKATTHPIKVQPRIRLTTTMGAVSR